jgi:hypothetical protein
MNVRRVLHVFAHWTGNVFRVVPKRYRFEVARRLALLFAPVFRRTPYYARRASWLDGAREESLRMLLRSMVRAKVEFDPTIVCHGASLVPDGPFIVVSAHYLLNTLMMRWVHDRGGTLHNIAAGPRTEQVFYAGTRRPLQLLYRGPAVLLQARQKLAEGSSIYLIAETRVEHPTWKAVDHDGDRRRYVSSAMMKFALRNRTPVVFTATYFDDAGQVAIIFERPSSSDADAMTDEFIEFFRRHTARVRR